RDVVVVPEHVLRVPGVLQRDQARPFLRAIGGGDLLDAGVGDEVRERRVVGVRREGRRGLPCPLLVPLVVGRVRPERRHLEAPLRVAAAQRSLVLAGARDGAAERQQRDRRPRRGHLVGLL